MKSINQIFIGLIIICIGIFSSSKIQAQEKEEYCNNRFNFCLQYTPELYSQKALSENGDGLKLQSVDGNVILSVSGVYNVLNNTIDGEFELIKAHLKNQEKSFNINSSEIKDNHFVVYASSGNEVYYQKTTFIGSHLVNISISSKMPTIEQSKLAIEVISNDLVFLVFP